MSVAVNELATAVAVILKPYLVEGGVPDELNLEMTDQVWRMLRDSSDQLEGFDKTTEQMVAFFTDPNSTHALARVLANILLENRDLASKIADRLGGKAGIQRIVATHHSLVENVSQELGTIGEQNVEAKNDATVRRAHQVSHAELSSDDNLSTGVRQILSAESGSKIENVVQFSGKAIFQMLEKAPMPLSSLMYVEKYRREAEESLEVIEDEIGRLQALVAKHEQSKLVHARQLGRGKISEEHCDILTA